MRLRLLLEYDGTDFQGWQIQPDGRTIQGTLEKALETIVRRPVRVEAAGRTDAGVHARGQVAAFSTDREVDPGLLAKSLNALAGPDIAVLAVDRVADDFDPRRGATARTYEYRIRNHASLSPFSRRYAWHVRESLAVEAMARAAGLLSGEHDFSSFQAADCDADDPVRRVTRSEVLRREEEIIYTVSATAFLRHMVRTIAGTLVQVGRGERSVEDFRVLLEARDRRLAGPTAPAHGLCLLAVEYGS